ncbi:hypothetical protein [Cysteiniphilum marinum]|uniref:hypothetical protein n=1 Tax=Cysteiniphilum marinum TaxID=2774191 RepID=UPI00193C51EC|nr:hypothetical protein [Cysteiniphilum marinum]
MNKYRITVDYVTTNTGQYIYEVEAKNKFEDKSLVENGEVSHWADLPKMPEVEPRAKSLTEVKADYVRSVAMGIL